MKQMIRFALPMVAASLLQQMYSMVDLAVIGKFVGSTGTVGVSTGGEVADMVLPVATAMSTGCQIYLAQLIGAKMHQQAQKTIGTCLTMLFIVGIVCMLIPIIFCTPILKALNCPEEAFSQATAYMIITAVGLPFVYIYNCICAVLRAYGDSKRPLVFVAISSVVNIVVDLILVVVFRMESAGVAIATVLAQIISSVAALVYLLKKKETFGFRLELSCFKIDASIAGVVLKIAIPQAIRSFLVRFSGLWVRAQINSYGMTYSAANSVGNKLEKFFEIYANALSQSSCAMIGQNLGARKLDRAKKVVYCSLSIGLVMATLISVIAVCIPGPLFSIFTSDEAVIAMAASYLTIMIGQYYLTAIVNSYQAMVVATGQATLNMVIGIVDGIVCKIGLGLLFVRVFCMGAEGYWLGISLSRFLPAIICLVFFYSGVWKKIDLTKIKSRRGR